MSGQNFSKKRQMILDTIRSTDTHPSARWVYEALREKLPNLSLGTVYRNITLFKEQGLVTSVANVDGEERIDGDTTPHAHFVCRHCGSVYDIPTDAVSACSSSCPIDGFQTDSAVLTYFGSCSGCNN